MTTTGVLDEALERLHATGPEFEGWLSNHGPMAVEALVRHGRDDGVHRWLDRYADRLEERPAAGDPIRDDAWAEALGDGRRLGDWLAYFDRRLVTAPERPWREVLATWWPRLLPGIAGGATHPVIRVGHAVVSLRAGENVPRLRELAHGLGYWAARHLPLPADLTLVLGPPAAAEALRAVSPVADQSQGIRHRLEQLTALPEWPSGQAAVAADAVPGHLADLVDATVRYYATHAHGSPVMLVHAATAPNAVLRTLPDLPRELWPSALAAAWAASGAVVAAYRPAGPASPAHPGGASAEELFARAVEHGDEHAIKLADTALDVAARHRDDETAAGAVLRATELIAPL
ncbi:MULTISPECIES: questin oxidase family protein [unclassified Streptomyces]|uniref:questin oxidase family protein n=1 Tax=unclassified Streptomyces TaxID=2593676 RepID=UPI0022B6A07A|nr:MULTISPECIES: questin oxidase family protein [unclassified Streptomyces]MCZ7417332.1 questin oxidase family protein [Streptomyces sp. WMMC897]MCZ7432841.1 questin oxidase family protein [Streptomyces sp. WMMC1477]